MPVYEYEPEDRDCLMCDGRVAVLQEISEQPLRYCPYCGLDVRRVVSKVQIKIAGAATEDKNSRRGFTTWRRAETGIWEKLSGEGPDMLVGTKEDVAAVEAEKSRPKLIDLDEK